MTLVTDGPFDRVLRHPVQWVLRQNGVNALPRWADLSILPRPRPGLVGRVAAAVAAYPCDLLVIHRDAEGELAAVRLDEIRRAVRSSGCENASVCLVPIRMTEAWLLFDEEAIRAAAGNPNGTVRVQMPRLQNMEATVNPKAELHDLLIRASELTGRHVRRFNPKEASYRVGELIQNYAPLRALSAFAAFESELSAILGKLL